MKKYILISLLFISNSINAQQDGMFKNGFMFKHGKIDTLRVINSDTILPNEYRTIYIKLKGVVTLRNEDSLFINFWPIKSDPSSLLINNISKNDSSYSFVFKITNWKGNKKHFDLPYRFTQLMATNIPFRVSLDSGKLESDFLNANATFVWVSGTTRIYKSKFVEPRNRYFAYGPYLGLTSIVNPASEKKEFGLNYGINFLGGFQGLNIVVALGLQNGFKLETKKTIPYVGFGIGFKLFETFSPIIKNKE